MISLGHGDPSDTLAHRDDGFIQVMCRGKQQIYDTLLQLPAVGMHSAILTPTMPAYYGIKDSHRSGRLVVDGTLLAHFLDVQAGGKLSGTGVIQAPTTKWLGRRLGLLEKG